MPPPPPPALPDELLEEIFLRLPPDEPACLVRASLASKPWLGVLTGPSFRTRYREFHRAPPMLGFVYSGPLYNVPKEENTVPYFVPTTNFCASIPNDQDSRDTIFDYFLDFATWDCHHGRVLSVDKDKAPMLLVVWDPMTGGWRSLYAPDDCPSQQAAVICAVSGCDHRACHQGPFQLVFIALDKEDGRCVAYESISSLETCEQSRHLTDDWKLWSDPCYGLDHLANDACIKQMPPVLIEDALHFMLAYVDDGSVAILKYNLGSKCLSLIDAPLVETDIARATILTGTNDGSLGFARVDGLTLNLWSRQMCSDGVAAWTQRIVINLKELLPIRNPKKRLRLIGSVEGKDIIFVTTDLGIYKINLNSLQWKKICKREKYHALFPYMSFYNRPGKVSHCDAAH